MDKRINIFVVMDSVPNCHDIIVNTLMDAVMESINNIVSILYCTGTHVVPNLLSYFSLIDY